MSTVDAAIISYITNGGGSSGGGSSDVAKRLEDNGVSLSVSSDHELILDSSSVIEPKLVFTQNGQKYGPDHHPLAISAEHNSDGSALLKISSPCFLLESIKNRDGGSFTQLTSNTIEIEGNLTVQEGFAFSAPNVYTKDEIEKINFVNKDHKITCRIEGLGIVIPAQPGGIPLGSVLIFKRADGKYMHYIFIEKSDANYWISDGVATIPNIAMYDSSISGYKITYSGAQLDDSCGLFFKGSNTAINGTDANATMVYTDAEIYSMFHYLLNKINDLSAGTS